LSDELQVAAIENALQALPLHEACATCGTVAIAATVARKARLRVIAISSLVRGDRFCHSSFQSGSNNNDKNGARLIQLHDASPTWASSAHARSLRFHREAATSPSAPYAYSFGAQNCAENNGPDHEYGV
jgi:hypothetical protein